MASTYLTRNHTCSASTFTYSTWIKVCDLSTNYQYFFSYEAAGSGNAYGLALDGATNTMYYYGSGANYTTQKVRDPSAWYHVVLKVTSGTGIIYINGEEAKTGISVPSFSSGESMNIGAYVYGSTVNYHFDGYVSDTHFIDGTAYAPTTFAQTDTTGVWAPIVSPSVTYGTNGFYLKFANSGAMGTDSSGNSNTFSVGAGTLRQVTDTPTNVFATINSINASSNITISKGNLQTTAVAAWYSALGTIYATSGKWYFESVLTTDNWVMVGVAPTSQDINLNPGAGAGTKSMALVFSTDSSRGDITYNNVNSAYTDGGHGIDAGDIISVALDLDNNNVKFYKNNTQLYNLSNLLSDEPYTFGVSHYNGSVLVSNFGQDGTFSGNKTAQNNADGNGKGNFYYAPPSGYLALCTDNLSSTLTIPVNDGSSAFHTQLYTGTGSARTITNDANSGNFQPDWVWVKHRNDSTAHSNNLVDAVRGGTKTIYSNSDGAQETITTGITGFATDGFTLGTNAAVNNNNINYKAWQWKAGGTAPTNTYAVKVVSDSGNKYRFDDYGTSAITLELQEGGTFTFDQSDSSNAGHPLRFSSTADGTHGGGSEYTTGVTTTGTPGQAGAKTVITVAGSAPTLYYYCTQHSGMGGQANTGSLFGFTNVKGLIQSVVSPNTTAGFSIVTYTATGSSTDTIGHGLSKQLAMVMVKKLNAGRSWHVGHKNLAFNSASDSHNGYISLDSLMANEPSNGGRANIPNATTFQGQSTNGDTMVAYCFAEIEGYSRFNKYTGNGSSNGTFVYTGFRPAYLMTRRTSAGSDGWAVFDSARDPTNGMQYYEFINNGGAEGSGTIRLDFLSNGFKWRQSGGSWNGSGEDYIYMAFAENPLVTSTGKPVTAR